jgi:F-type H+-transporting ATPase subunit gamma
MAGGQERVLRRRIKSIDSTKKITRAMELIAASQIARAQSRIAGSRPYVEGLASILRETADDGGTSRLVGDPAQPENVMVLAVVADRGLCGAYNSAVLRTTERLVRAGTATGSAYRILTVGKKAIAYFRFRNQPIEHIFQGMTDKPTFADAREVAKVAVQAFMDGEVDLVQVVSTRFRSAGTQVVETRQLLPVPAATPGLRPLMPGETELEREAADSGRIGAIAGEGHFSDTQPANQGFYEFEPDGEQLLELLVPQYAEAAVYAALLEASASEHTARQRAMSAATENAEELNKTLRRVMNRARQDSITTEIMEIVGGSEALRQAAGRSGTITHLPTPEEQIV